MWTLSKLSVLQGASLLVRAAVAIAATTAYDIRGATPSRGSHTERDSILEPRVFIISMVRFRQLIDKHASHNVLSSLRKDRHGMAFPNSTFWNTTSLSRVSRLNFPMHTVRQTGQSAS